MSSSVLWLVVGSSLLCGLSLACKPDQYPWPVQTPRRCCDKCKPGEAMLRRRPENNCEIVCEPCEGGRFMDSYNVELNCNVCRSCDKSDMEVRRNCSSTRDTECSCRPGFRCKDKACSRCERIPTEAPPTARPTRAPPTSASRAPPPTTRPAPWTPIRDPVWLLVVVALLCAGIALAVVTRVKPFLRWIRSRYGFLLDQKPPADGPEDGDGDVSKPVQEVCGKCEKLLDVCVKD